MKRIKTLFSVLLSVLILVSMTVIAFTPANAATTFTRDKIVYSIISNTEAHVYGYNGTDAVVEIPSKVDSRTITGVDSNAFENNSVVEKIYLPDTVKTIGDWAFGYCEKLNYVKIPNKVTSIGNYAFAFCPAIDMTEIECEITKISVSMYQQSGIKSISLPYNVSTIQTDAFNGCKNLTEISIPNRITLLGARAFANCTGVKTVTFGKGVTAIPDRCFYGCTSLDNVVLSDTIKTLGDYVFQNCTGLNKIYIGKNCATIGNTVFANCSNVTVYGYRNTAAADYAQANSINFVALDDIDKTELQLAITTAKSILSNSNSPYTAESLGNLQTAVTSADAVLSDIFALQTEVDNAFTNVNSALNSLELSSNEELSEYIYGDADGNGKLTVRDVTMIQSICVGAVEATALKRLVSDVNNDGVLTVRDVTQLQRSLVGYYVERVGKFVPKSLVENLG